MMLKALHWMHDRIAALNVGFTALAMIVLGLIGFEGMVAYNQSSNFCTECHVNRGPYQNIDLDSKAHEPYKNGEADCLDCHTDKDFHAFAVTFVKESGRFLDRFTNDRVYPAFETLDVKDEQCLKCHTGMLDLKDADALELSPGLAKIGLRFDHKRHFDAKEFGTDQIERLRELNDKETLTEGERDEKEFIERVRIGNCAQCHERDQLIDPGQGLRRPDRQINFFSVNPMRCSGCHVDAVTSVHPGSTIDPPLALPSEQICRRCHNGRLHGRMTVFPARCDSDDGAYTEYCIKCHPGIQPGIRKTGKEKHGTDLTSE